MATGIHRWGYTFNRPTTPNLTDQPLGVAPMATVAVYLTGTLTLASLYTNAALSNPLSNPLTSDVNGFYAYYVDPSLGDVDEQFSGTGITTPYTLTAVLDLDPRVASGAASIVTLTANLATETTNREAADLVLQEVGVRYPLGGSIESGQTDASTVDAFDNVVITIDGTLMAAYTLTVFAQVWTANAGTTVQPILENLTTATVAGSGTASGATTPTTQSFAATLAPGVNQYKLRLVPSNGSNAVYGNAYAALT